jgi:regulator of replication initiation timing
VADTERQLSEAVSRVKTLESELEILKQKQELREAKLKSRTEALSNFMNKMDEEKDKYKLALEGKHCCIFFFTQKR